jgi:hypothetical protein
MRVLLAVSASVFFVAGCGDDAGNVEVHPVRGVVKFDGQPMKGGGSIAFIPVSATSGKTAGGEILPDGTYVLSTYADGDGSMTGDFRVVVTQVTVIEPPPTEDGQPPAEVIDLAVPEEDHIPAIYGDYDNSPLTATVKAEDNEINFDLKRQ